MTQDYSYEDVVVKIVEAIRAKYDMNPHEFSKSDIPEQLGLKKGNTTYCYLSGASRSYRAYKILFKHLGLGDLQKKIVQVKEISYFVKTDSTSKKPRVIRRKADVS